MPLVGGLGNVVIDIVAGTPVFDHIPWLKALTQEKRRAVTIPGQEDEED